MKTKILIITTFVLLVSACDSELPLAENEAVDLIRPVKLIEVGQSNTNEFLNFPAVIQSQQLSVLTFEIGGMLNDLLVIEAQKVQKGDVLAKLDQRDLQTKLKSALAQFKKADTEYQRASRLIKEDAISRSVHDERKSARDVYKSKLETAEKSLQDSTLIAPYSGVIAKVSIEKRQIVQSGEPAITLLGKRGLEAKFNLPSSIMARAKKQQEPSTDSYVTLDVAPGLKIPALFKEVSLEADPVSQTYEIIFTFEQPKGVNVLPGMNAMVWLKDPRRQNSTSLDIRVPLASVTIDGDQKYVWVMNKKSMTVTKRKVSIEDGIGETLRVSVGLESGELIVVAGVAALTEGMKVRPWSK